MYKVTFVHDASTETATSSKVHVEEFCFLCESPVDVKFEPCGHALMCSTCAQRAKKCPQCKVKLVTGEDNNNVMSARIHNQT